MKTPRDFNPRTNPDLERDINFVVRRYRKGRFSVDQGWKRLGIGRSIKWIRMRVAAAAAAVVVLSASAAFLYHAYYLPDEPQIQQTRPTPLAPTAVVRVLDFEDAPLKDVIAKIEEVYGVEIQNIPEDIDEYTLSMHYEGNVGDLLNEINDILDTQLTINR